MGYIGCRPDEGPPTHTGVCLYVARVHTACTLMNCYYLLTGTATTSVQLFVPLMFVSATYLMLLRYRLLKYD